MRNKFIYKILSEAEDSSDDFFQMKLEKKRKKSFDQFIKQRDEMIIKLSEGIKNIKRAYKKRNWDNNSEKEFLELFSDLHVSDKFGDVKSAVYIYDSDGSILCAYDIGSKIFYMGYWTVYANFQTMMRKYDVNDFLRDMIMKYFKIELRNLNLGYA